METGMLGDVALAEENERKFKNDFELQYGGFLLSHLGKLSPVDFICYKKPGHEIVSVIEFKQRTNPHDKHPTIWLNLRKVSALKLLAAGFNCKAYYFVKWSDNVTMFINVHNVVRYPLVEAGTFKRFWPTDRELVYDIPIVEMLDMKPKPNLEVHG